MVLVTLPVSTVLNWNRLHVSINFLFGFVRAVRVGRHDAPLVISVRIDDCEWENRGRPNARGYPA